MGYTEESTALAMRRVFKEAGYDPARDRLPNYTLIEGATPAHFRSPDCMNHRSGVVVDWNLKITLDGLYAAGEQMYGPLAHSYAASTGRYAGRKAADYALQADPPAVSKDQVALEKERVYAPIRRKNGIEWKELRAGIARRMQYFCSEFITEKLLNMGLDALNDIEQKWCHSYTPLTQVNAQSGGSEHSYFFQDYYPWITGPSSKQSVPEFL